MKFRGFFSKPRKPEQPVSWYQYPHDASTCPYGPHRGPQGPNEDVSQCGYCWSPTFAMRPANETFGNHLKDCSLPIYHESYCKPGGSGHPPAEKIRG